MAEESVLVAIILSSFKDGTLLKTYKNGWVWGRIDPGGSKGAQ